MKGIFVGPWPVNHPGMQSGSIFSPGAICAALDFLS